MRGSLRARSAVWPTLATAAALATAGCLPTSSLGAPGSPGIGTDSGHKLAGRAASRAATSVIGSYEHTPAATWQRFAVGYPFQPRFSFGGHDLPTSTCAPNAQGISGVLPVAEGAPTTDMQRVGPVAVGTAGVPFLNAEGVFGWRGESRSESMRERVARMSTEDQGCQTSIFAFVRLGWAGYDDPVSVLR